MQPCEGHDMYLITCTWFTLHMSVLIKYWDKTHDLKTTQLYT